MLEILPNTDWSQELVRPALNLILRRLDRLFTKISKKNALKVSLTLFCLCFCNRIQKFQPQKCFLLSQNWEGEGPHSLMALGMGTEWFTVSRCSMWKAELSSLFLLLWPVFINQVTGVLGWQSGLPVTILNEIHSIYNYYLIIRYIYSVYSSSVMCHLCLMVYCNSINCLLAAVI